MVPTGLYSKNSYIVQNSRIKKDPKSNKSLQKKPNILLTISDDQSWSHASAYGDKTVRTPAFDWVVSKGVLFVSVFC